MKSKYTREQIVSFVKSLDVRAQKFTDEQIDNVINRGYAELVSHRKTIFSNEEVADLAKNYAIPQLNDTFEIEEDVTEIYDIYLQDGTAEPGDFHQRYIQGSGIYVNSEMAYRDNRETGRVHIDLGRSKDFSEIPSGHQFDTLVVKYYYTPKATDETVYMDAQTYLAWTDAMNVATNYFLKDVENEMRKQASLKRTSASIGNDVEDELTERRAMFGGWGL